MENIAEVFALVEGLVSALVDSPESVKIEVVEESEGGMTFRVQAPKTELGKLIGKHGRTARSLRTIMSAISMKNKRSFRIDIAEAP